MPFFEYFLFTNTDSAKSGRRRQRRAGNRSVYFFTLATEAEEYRNPFFPILRGEMKTDYFLAQLPSV